MRNIDILFLIILFALAGCKESESKNEIPIPNDLQSLDNLTAFSPHDQESDTVLFEQVATFESNEEIFMGASIMRFSVDDSGRVYIVTTRPGFVSIYVFNPDGSYHTTFTRFGQGPGEYESIRSIDIHDSRLYLLDARLQKFGIFSTEDYSHIKDEIITRDRLSDSDSHAMLLNVGALHVRNEEEFILQMRMIPRSRDQASQTTFYYRLGNDGNIEPGKLLELRGLTYYFPPPGEIATPIIMPFHRNELVSITEEGFFYTVWTENFLIKKYDPDGTYLSAIYYPIENAALSMDEIVVERAIERALNQYELPQTWPVIHTMEVDDENRLWVATITDDDSSFLWWVLDHEGHLLARFVLPGSRSARSAYSKPLYVIKDGYFYSHEQNFRDGTDRILKFRITFR